MRETHVRFTQFHGTRPNLALMKLGHWPRAQAHRVHSTRATERGMFEPEHEAA